MVGFWSRSRRKAAAAAAAAVVATNGRVTERRGKKRGTHENRGTLFPEQREKEREKFTHIHTQLRSGVLEN